MQDASLDLSCCDDVSACRYVCTGRRGGRTRTTRCAPAAAGAQRAAGVTVSEGAAIGVGSVVVASVTIGLGVGQW